MINQSKLLVEELKKNYLSVKCLKDHTCNNFRQEFIDAIGYGLGDVGIPIVTFIIGLFARKAIEKRVKIKVAVKGNLILGILFSSNQKDKYYFQHKNSYPNAPKK